MVPPGYRPAMLRAAIRSRWPRCPQYGQKNWRPSGFDTLVTFGTGGRGTAFVNTHDADPDECGFVNERVGEMGTPPRVEPPVLLVAFAGVGDALGVADDEGPDALFDGPVDDRLAASCCA